MKHSILHIRDIATLTGCGIAASVIGGGNSNITLSGLTGQTKGSVRVECLNWRPEFMDLIGS